MTQTKQILVKLVTKGVSDNSPTVPFQTCFPKNEPTWGSCTFVAPNEKRYDWFVVYDDTHCNFRVNCPKENTLLITSEPSSIKVYESAYLKQFAYVLSGQEDWALKHKGKIHSQPALLWYYNQSINYDAIHSHRKFNKTKSISTVCSSKQQGHTAHKKRYNFTQVLKKAIPEMDWYGKGVHSIEAKSDALDSYRYHIAIENHACEHWWTEKLADAFLGQTLPFYYGATNLNDYFPEQSYIAIDINQPQAAIDTIKKALVNQEYEKRLPFIQEARRRILEDYNLFATVSKIVESKHSKLKKLNHTWTFHKRHSIRKNLSNRIPCFYEKARGKIISLIKNR
jgi:hypothetical protein